MSDLVKAQFERDTLLVAGYKGGWTLAKMYAKYMSIGYTAKDVARLVRQPKGVWGQFMLRQPVSALIANMCPELFSMLAACTSMPDYIKVRNQVNNSSLDFGDKKTSDWIGLREVKTGLRVSTADAAVNRGLLAKSYQASRKSGLTPKSKTRKALA